MARGIKGGLESRFDPGGGDVPRLFPFKVNKGHDEHHVQTPERQGREDGESGQDEDRWDLRPLHVQAFEGSHIWDPMGSHGQHPIWAPMGSRGQHPMGSQGVDKDMGTHGRPLGTRGTPWDPMASHES